MKIISDKKSMFTITDVTLGELLFIQRVFREYSRGMVSGLPPIGEDILLKVNKVIEEAKK